MIHIQSKDDIILVTDNIIKIALEQEFQRLPNDYIYPKYGYFIIIESIEELKNTISLKFGDLESFNLKSYEYIEMIEQFDGYIQIVCILYSDFGVSLFVKNEIITKYELEDYLYN